MNGKQVRDVVFIAHRYIGLVVGLLAAAIAELMLTFKKIIWQTIKKTTIYEN
jgi:hypothetical protein